MQSSIKDIAKFRGAASSHNYNQLQESLFFDMTNMFNIMSEFENRLQETSELQVVDNLYTQMKLSELMIENQKLRSKIDTALYKDDRKIYIDVFNAEPIEVATTPVINKQFNQINLRNHSATSKLYLYDEGLDLVTIPGSLKYEILPVADENTIDNDLRMAFNGNINEFFVRKVVADDPMPKEMEIILELPDNIISSRNINSIEISPYPYNSLDILDIEYQLNGNWTRIPGFTSHKDYIAETNITEYGDIADTGYIKDAENIKLCFDKIAMAKVRIRLRQRTYLTENNKFIFYFGIKTLDINCENVIGNYCEFSSDIYFEEDAPKLITSIVPFFNNDRILSDQTNEKKSLMSYEFYEVDEDGAIEYIKNSLPIVAHNKHYRVVTKMYYDRINDINPSLRGLEIKYNLTDQVEEDNCTCIIKNITMNVDENIIIGFDKEAHISMLNASADIINDCEVPGHADNSEVKYKYKIKTSTSDCYIENDRLITKSEGSLILTVEVHYNGKIVKKDFTYNVIREERPTYTLNYSCDTNRGKLAGPTVQKIMHGHDATMVEAIPLSHSQFIKWSDEVKTPRRLDTNVTSHLDVEAIFEAATYPVTFMGYKAAPVLEVIEVQQVIYNSAAQAPTLNEIDGYKFLGWDKPFTTITGPLTVTAQYSKTHLVTFVDYNGVVLDKQVVEDGGSAKAPVNPVRPGFTFKGWDKPFTNIKTDTIVTALYEAKKYTVTFKNHDGTILKTEEVLYRHSATAPQVPDRPGYEFAGWDKAFSSIIDDLVVTATYKRKEYTVTFVDEHGSTLMTSKISHGNTATPPTAPDKTGYTFLGWEKQ